MHKFRLGLALVLATAILLAIVPPAYAGNINDCPYPLTVCRDEFPGTSASLGSSVTVDYTGKRLIISGRIAPIPKECFMPSTYSRNRFPKPQPTCNSKEKACAYLSGWDPLYACWQSR